MDSFINQKEIAAGWEEWKEGRRGGQRLCSRVKSGLSAEGQRCVGRAVTSGRFTAASSHLSTRDGDSRGAAATAETRSPEISQVLRCVCALGESVRSIGAPSVHLRGGRKENPNAVQQTKLSDDFERRACMSDVLASSERREKQTQECQSHLLEVLVLL